MFNPFVLDANIEVDGTTEEVSIPDCNFVRLYPVSGNSTVYINSMDNLPPVKMYEAVEIDNIDGQIKKLYIYSAAATTTNIKLIKYPATEIVRAGFEG